MLNIQRASAGSGKTYTLARQYILNLIAFKNEEGKWFLRSSCQIEDALTHILAITFTNKATNEMKRRIVENLSLLAKATNTIVTPQLLKDTPYLKEFHEITGKSYSDIGAAAERALRIVLNNYSQFKISTIDSFFQEILRTFTFEANLKDSYQLEIDSKFVTDAALDAAMHELDTKPSSMGNASFWLKTIMKQEAEISTKWNLFNKKASSKSIYAKLKSALLQLENENFKEIKEQLEDYFDSGKNIATLPKTYLELRDKANQERDNLLKKIKKAASEAQQYLLTNNIENQVTKIFKNHIDIAMAMRMKDSFGKTINTGKTVVLKKYFYDNHPVDLLAKDLYAGLDEWDNPSVNSYHKAWTVYGDLLPYLGLLLEIKVFLKEVLDRDNLIQLSDTSYILKKIIGNDDAPFVYERLGARLDHYLIDEFQDTSRMQWDVLHPLLNEGLSQDKDSLIIGDPKQSIYRFRNADHRLITQVVPSTFRNHKASGMSKEENTNWRSQKRIVNFNNYFFKALAKQLSEISVAASPENDFNHLYGNVVQYPDHKDNLGYVEIRRFSKEKISEDDDKEQNEDEETSFESFALSNLAPLIVELIERGYNQKDICVLVNTNLEGKEVVESFISYNDSVEENSQKIDFISEESLLVSSSPAVEIIIGVLEKLANPKPDKKPSQEEESGSTSEISVETSQKPKYYSWLSIKNSYNLFCRNYPDIPPAERLMKFLKEEQFDDAIPDLMKNLPVPTLSAIVEAAANTFLDTSMLKAEALYISSLQDLVTEYSASHANDPASFLEWWKTRGVLMSVATPEGTDAVQIMTIHKSKGLEFKCVIVPFANDALTPSHTKEEWRWITPVVLPELEFPPVLPVKTTKNLIGSAHEPVYRQYFHQFLTDKLNTYYVAFTRAKDELYIFTTKKLKKGSTIAHYLSNILTDGIDPELFTDEEKDWVMNSEELSIDEETDVITYGEPLTLDEIEAELKKDAKKEESKPKVKVRYLEEYFVNSKRPQIRSKVSIVLPSENL